MPWYFTTHELRKRGAFTRTDSSLLTNLRSLIFAQRDDIPSVLVVNGGMILHVSHVLLQLTWNIYESFVLPPLWYMCIDLRANVYNWSLSPMKTLHVIVCIAGSSKAVGNPASTGLHLLSILLVSLVNRRTGMCCLTSAHMKMCARTPSAELRRHNWMLHYSESLLLFSNGAFGKRRKFKFTTKMKTKTDERSLNLPDESCSGSFALLTFTVMKLLWKPQYYHNWLKSANNTKKIPIGPKLYSSFDQCGICIFRCRTRLYPVQVEYISLLDICF